MSDRKNHLKYYKMPLEKKQIDQYLSNIKSYYEKKYNNENPDKILITFVINFHMNEVGKIIVKERIDKDGFDDFYMLVSDIFDQILEMDVLAQIYEQGDKKMKKKLGLKRDKYDITGCSFKDLTFRNIFNRDFVVEGVTKIDGKYTYEISWCT
jgi:hypothetical protein